MTRETSLLGTKPDDVLINSPPICRTCPDSEFIFAGRTFLAPYGVPNRMPVYNKESAETKAAGGLPGQVVMQSNEGT